MRIRYAGRMWDVELLDSGTLDTLVRVRPTTWKPGDSTLYSHVDPSEIDVPYAEACGWSQALRNGK